MHRLGEASCLNRCGESPWLSLFNELQNLSILLGRLGQCTAALAKLTGPARVAPYGESLVSLGDKAKHVGTKLTLPRQVQVGITVVWCRGGAKYRAGRGDSANDLFVPFRSRLSRAAVDAQQRHPRLRGVREPSSSKRRSPAVESTLLVLLREKQALHSQRLAYHASTVRHRPVIDRAASNELDVRW